MVVMGIFSVSICEHVYECVYGCVLVCSDAYHVGQKHLILFENHYKPMNVHGIHLFIVVWGWKGVRV